jgi:hypothetical protein
LSIWNIWNCHEKSNNLTICLNKLNKVAQSLHIECKLECKIAIFNKITWCCASIVFNHPFLLDFWHTLYLSYCCRSCNMDCVMFVHTCNIRIAFLMINYLKHHFHDLHKTMTSCENLEGWIFEKHELCVNFKLYSFSTAKWRKWWHTHTFSLNIYKAEIRKYTIFRIKRKRRK